MMDQQRAAALAKQLSQLERDGERLREATRFIQDILSNERQGALGHVHRSKDLPIKSPHCTTFQPSGLPSPIQRELHQLQRIKKKLQLTASEIATLQTDYGLESASCSPSEEAAEFNEPRPHAPTEGTPTRDLHPSLLVTDGTPTRSSRTADTAQPDVFLPASFQADDPAAGAAAPTPPRTLTPTDDQPQGHPAHTLFPSPPDSLLPAAPSGADSQHSSSTLQASASAPHTLIPAPMHAPPHSSTLRSSSSSSSSRGASRLPAPPTAADDARGTHTWPRGLLRAPSSPATASHTLHAASAASAVSEGGGATGVTAAGGAEPPQHVHKVAVASRQGSGGSAAAPPTAAAHGAAEDDSGGGSGGYTSMHREGAGHSVRHSSHPGHAAGHGTAAGRGASHDTSHRVATGARGPSKPPTSLSAGRLGLGGGEGAGSPRESEQGTGGEESVSPQEVERLQARVAHLRPKAASAARLRATLAGLEAQAAEAKSLQARAADLTQLTERLPALRKQLTQNQAAAANVRALEKQLAAEQKAHPGEGELLTRLQAQERELAARAASVSEIKDRMQQLSMVALEVEQMESRVAVLAPIAGRLPVLQSQHEALLVSCKEVEGLEALQAEMRETVAQRRRLQMQINVLQPQAEGVEALRAQLAQVQQEAAEAEQLKQSLQEHALSATGQPGDSTAPQPGAALPNTAAGQQDLGVTPSRVRASGGQLAPGMGGSTGAVPGSASRRAITQQQKQQMMLQLQEQEQETWAQPTYGRSNTLQGLSAAAESLAALPPQAPSPRTPPPFPLSSAGPPPSQPSQPPYAPPTHRRPSVSSVISSSAETPPQEFMTPCRSFSRSSSCTSLSSNDPEVIGLCLPPLPPQWSQRGRSQSLFGDALWSPPVSGSFRQMRTPPRPPFRPQQPLSLTINVCEPPPLSLHLRVEQPLPGVPDEVLKRLQQAGSAEQQTSAALEEIKTLDTHREALEARIDKLRESPQALEVLRLQQHLLELQQQEVAQLETQVASLAGVGDRLSALRAERARLESLADEVFEAEAQLEETRAVKELQAQARAAKTEAEATEAEIASLEQSAVRLEEACGRRDTLVQHLAQLQSGAAEVERLEKEVAALAGADVVISKLHSRRSELEAKAGSIPELEAQCDARAAEIEHLSAKAAQLPSLQAEAAALSQQAATLPALEHEVESLRTQLKAVEGLMEAQHTLSQRLGSSTAECNGELAAWKAELEGQLANEDLASAAADVRQLEAQLHELRQQAERREALQALCENMASVPQQVSGLQSRVETLKVAVAERQRLHQETLELEEQLVSVAGPAGGLEGARIKHQQMLEAVDQARTLKAKVAMLAPEALQLSSLREQHAALQRDTAEASLLNKDLHVLRLRASMLRQLRALAEGAAAGGREGERGVGLGDLPSKGLEGGVAQEGKKGENGGNGESVWEGGGNGEGVQEGRGCGESEVGRETGVSGSNEALAEAQPSEVGGLLEQVFQRMRAAEAEQLGQQAEIEDLNERVKELTAALEVSNKSVRKLKSLARAVGRIRSGFVPEEGGAEDDDEDDELDSPGNLNAVTEEPESPMRANPVYRA